MQACRVCGRPKNPGKNFCTSCGTQFPDSDIKQSAAADQDRNPAGLDPGGNAPATVWDRSPGEADQGGHLAGAGSGYGWPGGRVVSFSHPEAPDAARGRRLFRPVPVAVIAMVALAAGAGSWFLIGRQGTAQPGLHELTKAPAAVRQSAPGPAASVPAVPVPAASPSVTMSGSVSVATAVAQAPAAVSVADFLGQYFAAINAHDYQSYVALLDPQMQQNMTPQQFDSGYQSTVDSAEMLTGISVAANGDTVADVTFTSHQNPAASVDQKESCTDWQISLFLQQSGGGYLIDPPPADYHASHQAC